ncbi:MAG: carbohydrate kinase [Fuerstiella sp.]|nr:carbohydrate kinase [Fuerstiella sp.]MCP4858065.1 carbohydrate kinase [Fuerstiella sp.]
MKRPAIISFGEVLWDLFPEGEQFGGAPANFACHAAILGANVTMVSAVGEDRRGRQAVDILKSYGIDVSLLQPVADAVTGTVAVEIDSDGVPAFTIHENSAWDRLDWNIQLEARVAAADAVYFGTLGQRSEVSRFTIRQCVKAARAAGIPRVLDINLRAPFYDSEVIRESVRHASILKLSDEELSEVCAGCGIDNRDPPDAQLRRVLDTNNLDLVVMTRGAEGAVLVTADEIVQHPGIPTNVHDTVGAGDSFTAAFLLGLLRGEPHDQMLHKACVNAVATCGHTGAVPWRPEHHQRTEAETDCLGQ